MKLEFPEQIFEKYSNIKFNKSPFRGSRVVPYWRTDRGTDGRKEKQKHNHGEAHSCFSQFSNRAKRHES
jgi:hypothetical protein